MSILTKVASQAYGFSRGLSRGSRDIDRMKEAAEIMDRNRTKLGELREWPSVEVVRKWRELRRPL